MDYKRIVTHALLDAHTKGWLNVGNLIQLKSVDVEESVRHVKSMVGRIKYNSKTREYKIIIYPQAIRQAVDKGQSINGLAFKSVDDAAECVLKHELCHLINDFNGGKGHDKMFKKIALELFNQTSIYVEDVCGTKDCSG